MASKLYNLQNAIAAIDAKQAKLIFRRKELVAQLEIEKLKSEASGRKSRPEANFMVPNGYSAGQAVWINDLELAAYENNPEVRAYSPRSLAEVEVLAAQEVQSSGKAVRSELALRDLLALKLAGAPGLEVSLSNHPVLSSYLTTMERSS